MTRLESIKRFPMIDRTSVWIVIPTYNEASNVTRLVEGIGKAVPGVHVLIVDDASPDGTGAIVERLVPVFSGDLRVLHRSGKQGIGSAIRAGFKQALSRGAEWVIQMDADGSHDPDVIPRLLEPAEQGAEVVVGSRRVAGGGVVGWGPLRSFMSWGAAGISRALLRLKTNDVTSGFKCYRRSVLEQFDLATMGSDGYAFQEETIFLAERRGFVIKEIPILFKDRSEGRSKLSRTEILKFFIQLFRLRFLR